MRIKRFHWNITILALFVLLASALTGVLVALYMKNFMKYSEEITNYEKSSYMAKAWTELGLAIVGSHNVWLEYSFWSWSTNFEEFIEDNFDCPYQLEEWETCPNLPYFSLAISWMNTYYNMCSSENQITIWKWLSAIIPLFRDSRGDWKNDLDNSALQKTADSNLVVISLNNNSFGAVWDASERNFWTLYMDAWYILKLNQRKGGLWIINNWNDFIRWQTAWNQNPYLVIANPDSANSRKLCVRNNDWKGIPQETVIIKAIWYYKDKQLGTETLTKKALPEFLQWDNYLVQ